MTTITRHSLIQCRTKDCPFTPDEHEEWMSLCSQAPFHGHRHDQPTHQHHPKKGMGGNNPLSKIVAILCWPMQDRIDNFDWGNDVKEVPGRGKVYFAWDLHGNTLIERSLSKEESDPVLSAAADGEPTSPGEEQAKVATSAAAPSAGSKEVSDGTLSGGASSRSVVQLGNLGGDSVPLPRLTHEQRVAIAQEIKDAEWGRQWFAGDTGNAWIAELGEEAEQYLSDFGYVHESLSNILRVCAAIPRALRSSSLRFSHHVVVADLNLEDIDEWLGTCEIEQWSVAEFRRQVKGTKLKVKRWSLEELRTLMATAFSEAAFSGTSSVQAFLDWLGDQE